MKLNIQTPKKVFNKAFLKQRPLRSEIEDFKANLKTLLSKVEARESEENKKNHLRDFLLDTYYKGRNETNTKDRKDLVIHLGKTNESKVGVIIEAKTPESADMVKVGRLNKKAFHELVLYYFDERYTKDNSELKNLAITNIYEWFIFDANVFDKQIYRNTKIRRLYETKVNDEKDNPFFYEELRKIIENLDEEIICAHFNLRDYQTFLENEDLEDDKNLIELYKILSPFHFLKEPFAEDSNQLNKQFYDELLHILGLEEVKIGAKSVIRRKEAENRDSGSLIENAITILKTKDSLRKVKDIANYGETTEDRYFNVALELCLIWINRILFLKLLESQLVNYQKGNKEYRFLNVETIFDFDELFTLFHQVLAKTFEDRSESVREKYKRVPYLNSSLFEQSELEDQTITIESLKDTATLEFNKATILKNLKAENKKLTTLEYLFKFLDAYDFASEGVEDVQEDNRSLINASVLGKVFEKINGYKDGSIFTPGFITMYMCRQAIRLAVVQKFKDKYGWNISEFADIGNYLQDRRSRDEIIEFNQLINSLHLCDPAVGSGHFLVSSLNEIIAIKSELGILADETGVRFSDYEITIENDELIITDERGDIFEYQINENGEPAKQAQRLQKALFHEKQTLIENCLFGVDINSNSVKICRLRLWIELLKNAYYRESSNYTDLETLPNIDINIKEGNSLLSRFALDEDLSKVLKQIRYSIEDYRNFVLGYKETRDREKKREFEANIKQIKEDFKTQLFFFSPERTKLADLENQLKASEGKQYLFGEDENEKAKRLKNEETLKARIVKAKDAIKQIEENAIYKNAFEWRFEFPEILDDEGNFLGFDVVIGNPPYLTGNLTKFEKQYYKKFYQSAQYQLDLYILFIEKGTLLLKESGVLSYITPNSWLKNLMMSDCREFVLENLNLLSINPNIPNVFELVSVDSLIFVAKRMKSKDFVEIWEFIDSVPIGKNRVKQNRFYENDKFVFDVEVTESVREILIKIKKASKPLLEFTEISRGINPYDALTGQSKEVIKNRAYHSDFEKDETFVPELKGRHVQNYIYDWDAKHYISFGDWLAAPREPKYFTGERLVFREILGEKLVCAYMKEDFKIDRSLYIAIPKEDSQLSVKFLLSILSTRLLAWFFRYEKNEFDALFPKIRVAEFRNLPIPEITPKEQKSFIKLVDEILEKKKLGQETEDLENEIDCLVYRLYDLTDEEIAIVEGNAEARTK